MLTLTFFNTAQINNIAAGLADLPWERGVANLTLAGPTPLLARNIGVQLGPNDMGRFSVGQLMAVISDLASITPSPLGSNPTFGNLLNANEVERMKKREAVLLVDLAWRTGQAIVGIEDAQIQRWVDFISSGVIDAGEKRVLTVESLGGNARTIAERPLLLTHGDTIEITTDAPAGANSIRMTFDLLADDDAVVAAAAN